MKKMLTLIALVAIVMLVSATCFAAGEGTLWAKEGIVGQDGYIGIDAKLGFGGGNEQALNNFVVQYGSGSYSGVYSNGWYPADGSGDESIDVEADIEMYYQSTTTNPKIYFHLANPFTATTAQKEALVGVNQTTNHPMYIGVGFPTSYTIEKFVGGTAPTGEIIGGMKGLNDAMGRPMVAGEAFNVKFTLDKGNNGIFVAPVSFGAGASGTIQNTLWWDPSVSGGTGTSDVRFKVEIFPAAGQADGEYRMDPVIAVAPEL